jgi:aryl-alcohol dehydrogenase-like predicted oxidoreductase
MVSIQQLGLGTAQFGFDYGLSNNSGQVPLVHAREILKFASNNGISALDTAAEYGVSESIVGACLKDLTQAPFAIYTKTIAIRTDVIQADDVARLGLAFELSLKKLGCDHVAGLLVHHANDLLSPGGGHLFDYLLELKSIGKIKKIGVSVYDKAQIDQLLCKYQFDFMQLPINVFDQRLLQNGTIASLGERGIEIHARSIFLQGVLMMQAEKLPEHLNALKKPLMHFQAKAKLLGLSPLAASLAFIKKISQISTAIIGVVTVDHLKECVEAYKMNIEMNFEEFSQENNLLIDPRTWSNNS